MTYIRFENHDCIAEALRHREDDVNTSVTMMCSQALRSTAHSSPPLCSCVDGDVSSSSSGVFPHVTTEMGLGGEQGGLWEHGRTFHPFMLIYFWISRLRNIQDLTLNSERHKHNCGLVMLILKQWSVERL